METNDFVTFQYVNAMKMYCNKELLKPYNMGYRKHFSEHAVHQYNLTFHLNRNILPERSSVHKKAVL